jgi:hypothetical protein
LGSLYRNRRESYVNGLRVNIEKVVRHSIGTPLEDFDVGIMQPWSFERGKWCTPFFGEFSNASSFSCFGNRRLCDGFLVECVCWNFQSQEGLQRCCSFLLCSSSSPSL